MSELQKRARNANGITRHVTRFFIERLVSGDIKLVRIHGIVSARQADQGCYGISARKAYGVLELELRELEDTNEPSELELVGA